MVSLLYPLQVYRDGEKQGREKRKIRDQRSYHS